MQVTDMLMAAVVLVLRESVTLQSKVDVKIHSLLLSLQFLLFCTIGVTRAWSIQAMGQMEGVFGITQVI